MVLKDNDGRWNLRFVIEPDNNGKELYSTYQKLKNKETSEKGFNESESELYQGLSQALNTFIQSKFSFDLKDASKMTLKNCTCYNKSPAYSATFSDIAAKETIIVFYYFLENSPNHIISYAEMEDDENRDLNSKKALLICRSAYVETYERK